MGSKSKESSKELLVLEHTSQQEHIENLLNKSSTKPKIERLSSSVLQRVQQFLPELRDANESIPNSESTEKDEQLCCEVGENFEGPAIEMTLVVTSEQDQQTKIMETLENAPTLEESDTDTESDDSDSSSKDL